jgi:hypothetical protein
MKTHSTVNDWVRVRHCKRIKIVIDTDFTIESITRLDYREVLEVLHMLVS